MKRPRRRIPASGGVALLALVVLFQSLFLGGCTSDEPFTTQEADYFSRSSIMARDMTSALEDLEEVVNDSTSSKRDLYVALTVAASCLKASCLFWYDLDCPSKRFYFFSEPMHEAVRLFYSGAQLIVKGLSEDSEDLMLEGVEKLTEGRPSLRKAREELEKLERYLPAE